MLLVFGCKYFLTPVVSINLEEYENVQDSILS